MFDIAITNIMSYYSLRSREGRQEGRQEGRDRSHLPSTGEEGVSPTGERGVSPLPPVPRVQHTPFSFLLHTLLLTASRLAVYPGDPRGSWAWAWAGGWSVRRSAVKALGNVAVAGDQAVIDALLKLVDRMWARKWCGRGKVYHAQRLPKKKTKVTRTSKMKIEHRWWKLEIDEHQRTSTENHRKSTRFKR